MGDFNTCKKVEEECSQIVFKCFFYLMAEKSMSSLNLGTHKMWGWLMPSSQDF